jgi:hypothetical protein
LCCRGTAEHDRNGDRDGNTMTHNLSYTPVALLEQMSDLAHYLSR